MVFAYAHIHLHVSVPTKKDNIDVPMTDRFQ